MNHPICCKTTPRSNWSHAGRCQLHFVHWCAAAGKSWSVKQTVHALHSGAHSLTVDWLTMSRSHQCSIRRDRAAHCSPDRHRVGEICKFCFSLSHERFRVHVCFECTAANAFCIDCVWIGCCSASRLRPGPTDVQPVRLEQDVLHSAALQVRHARGLRRRLRWVRLQWVYIFFGFKPTL